MDRRRGLLAVLAAAVVGVGAHAVTRDSGDPGSPALAGGTTTTSEDTTTTSSALETTTASSPPSTLGTATTATLAAAPPFQSSVQPVSAAQLGSSWHPNMGCAEPAGLRLVTVSHWGYDGAVHQGRLVVAAAETGRIVAVFSDVYAARFPIERMEPIDAYGGDDEASMRANNTSGFNCRYVSGTTKLSQHALGRAVDVNPLVNPYVRGLSVDPPEGAPYVDRNREDTGMIHRGDAVVGAFAAQGWGWGGSWSGGKDYQHFSASGG